VFRNGPSNFSPFCATTRTSAKKIEWPELAVS
jgi:hypothetical protein